MDFSSYFLGIAEIKQKRGGERWCGKGWMNYGWACGWMEMRFEILLLVVLYWGGDKNILTMETENQKTVVIKI